MSDSEMYLHDEKRGDVAVSGEILLEFEAGCMHIREVL